MTDRRAPAQKERDSNGGREYRRRGDGEDVIAPPRVRSLWRVIRKAEVQTPTRKLPASVERAHRSSVW